MFSGDLLDTEDSAGSQMAPGVSMLSTEMDDEMNPLERDHFLSVVLPGGLEKNVSVNGSKPVMDFLVTLCANYHLSPSDYTVEFLSPNKNNISFKPNSPIGLLDAEKIVLKPKGMEEKMKRPYMPEATVRLLINYNKSHKTVVRVNPRLPLEMLLPLVCDKCEFHTETTVLLRDAQSTEPLDMSKTLNDHGLREMFARDTAVHPVQTSGAAAVRSAEDPPPPPQELQKKEKKQTKRGFFSLFRRRKKKDEAHAAVSAPSSPGLSKRGGVVCSERVSSVNTLPADLHKKRRAPPPPLGASPSVPNNLSTCHVQGAQSSGESAVRSTKRRAPSPPPPPPCTNTLWDLKEEADVPDALETLDELRETDKSASLSASPFPSQSHPSSSPRPSPTPLHQLPDSHRLSSRRKDFSDARSALAKVLTSSVSKGALAKRLRNSTAFPKFHVSSCVSMTPECLDKGLEPVLVPGVPAGNRWEEPAERTQTTFEVVLPKRPSSCDPQLILDVPDQTSVQKNPESQTVPDAATDQTEREEAPCSPDGPESETEPKSPDWSEQTDSLASPPPLLCSDHQNAPEPPLVQLRYAETKPIEDLPAAESLCHYGDMKPESHLASVQSLSADLDPCGSAGQKDEDEEEKPDLEEGSFPPPPPPVFFKEELDVAEKDDSISPTSNRRATAPSEAQKTESTSAEQPGAPSRFALAVAMAVQRSRLHSLCKELRPQVSGSPHNALPSPPRSTYQYGA